MQSRSVPVFLAGMLLASAAISNASSVGWRLDGASTFPTATPVTSWAPDQHVIWSTPLPSWGNSCPVVVGDRMFTTTEPDSLICLSLKDGAILWQRTHKYDDLMTPDDQAQLASERVKVADLRKQQKPIKEDLKTKQDALLKTPDDQALKTAMAALQAQVADLQKQIDACQVFHKWEIPPTNPANGYTSSTPVTDGEKVYAVFGSGIVAAYDLEGKRLWIRLVEKPTHGWGHSASPVLVGGVLLTQINNTLHCLDARTGEDLWHASVPQAWGTPIVTRVGNLDVIVSPSNLLINAADGKLLGKIPSKALEYNSPLVIGDTVYFVQGETVAARLAPREGGLDVQELWRSKIKSDRYYASSVVWDGLLYAINQTGAFSVLDTKDGSLVYEQKIDLGGTIYPSVVLAGKVILVSSDNGKSVLIQPGREYKEIGQNTLEPFRGTPVCVGARMYIHGQKKAYCLGE